MAISGEFYFVKIGDVYLTDDGTSMGSACLTKVDNLHQLFSTIEGATQIPLSGRAYNFNREASKQGIKLTFHPVSFNNDVMEDIRDLIDAATVSDNPIAVEISQGPGAITLLAINCDGVWEGGDSPVKFGSEFYEDNVYDGEIRLVTRGLT